MKKIIINRKNIFIILSFIAFISLIFIIMDVYEYKKGRDTYNNLEDISNDISKDDSASVNSESKEIINEESLRAINGDYKFWIKIANTNVSYPVVQTKDNDYYLNHDFNHNEIDVGCLFIDYRNDITNDKNLLIYGHNMNDGSMFHDLTKYKDKEFFENNSIVSVTVNNVEYSYKIFSVYVTTPEDIYTLYNFKSEDEYKNYLKNIENKSLFKSDTKVNKDDKILTFSTCSYEFDDARTIVHAVLVK